MEQHTFCYRKLLLEHIDSPIDQKRLAIRSSYQRLLTLWSTNKLVVTGSSYIRAHWPPDQSKPSSDQELLSELIDSLINQQTSWDQKLLSELIDSLIDQQTCCDQELLSELIVTPIDKHWISSDWPKKLSAIGGSYQGSLNPWLIKNLLQSGAPIIGHRLPDQLKNILRSEALIRARWLPNRSTNLLWLGALIRAPWGGGAGSSYQSSLTPPPPPINQ